MSHAAPDRFRRGADALWRGLPDGVIVLSATGPNDQPVFVEGTGAALWAGLAEAVTLMELASSLATAFGADPVQVAADIGPVIDRLVTEGVVDRLPP